VRALAFREGARVSGRIHPDRHDQMAHRKDRPEALRREGGARRDRESLDRRCDREGAGKSGADAGGVRATDGALHSEATSRFFEKGLSVLR